MRRLPSRFSAWIGCISIVIMGDIAHDAQAQRSARSGLRLGNIAAVQIIILDDAQSELMLSDKQRDQAVEVHDRFVTERRKIFAEATKENGDRGRKLSEAIKRATAKVEATLSETQRKRLKEILLQVNGAVELLKDETAGLVGITDEQKKELANVQRANASARREAREKLQGATARIRTAKMAEIHQQGEKKLLDVLTAEQRQRFAKMQGKKITLDLYQ